MRGFRTLLLLVVTSLFLTAAGQGACRVVGPGDPRWKALDAQYATIERATFLKDAKLLFSVYAPDFEAHQFNGEVWKLSQSAAYSTAGFEQVTQNISLSNTIISLADCGEGRLLATVLQQWSRRQRVRGTERLFQTTTVQDETWAAVDGSWLRKRVDNERPGAWLVDLKRIDPAKPYDPNAPEYDPHGTKSTP